MGNNFNNCFYFIGLTNSFGALAQWPLYSGDFFNPSFTYPVHNEILKMLNSSLPLCEGSLIEFIYTPTNGKTSISFRAGFYSNYSVEFTGTADNGLCLKNCLCGTAGYFTVEGQYVVNSSEGQIADKGTFDLEF